MTPPARHRRTVIAAAAAALTVIAGSTVYATTRDDQATTRAGTAATVPATLATLYDLERLPAPPRTLLRERGTGRLVATLTDGARTVLFHGPERVLTETGSSVQVPNTARVRLAPASWHEQAPTDPALTAWIHAHTNDTSPDLIDIALQYLRDAPEQTDDKGSIVAGDAKFGIERGDSVDGADFHEYMGVAWEFPNGRTMRASPKWLGALDCSGYLRMVYGFRGGLTLHSGPATGVVDGVPRTAHAMAYHARSVLIASGPTPERPPAELGELQPGDLVFFALRGDKSKVSHSGIYLGDDRDGHPRFVSSRDSTQGPSFADSLRSKSTLDDPVFARSLRRIIRL